jgi:Na+/H+ antiporter NhaD/arsenite permease-like protein
MRFQCASWSGPLFLAGSVACGQDRAMPYGLPWAMPFVGLVLTIAVAPLISARQWERHYGKAALAWSLAFVIPNFARGGDGGAFRALLDVALNEYLPFVLLLGTLYVISGGLRIRGVPRASPAGNTAMLALGTVLAGIIGTPGASLLMLRPLVRANRHRRRSTHVFVFFILLVSNVGGALSTVGDPPLFLGFLKGVPFWWPSVHLALPTATLAAGLLATFYALDRYLRAVPRATEVPLLPQTEKFGLEGGINLPLLAAALAVILLRALGTPRGSVSVFGVGWDAVAIVSDVALLALASASFLVTRPATRQANDFEWGPLVEVAVLFAAIFVTLVPVTEMMAAGVHGPMAPLYERMFADGAPDNRLFFRVTGILSATLDNAPTYLVFFGLAGNDAARLSGPLAPTLAAISAGACYFGGLTYLGNAPNLMVRAIVEQHGMRMPSFFGYIAWAAVCLVPWLLLVEAIFFD